VSDEEEAELEQVMAMPSSSSMAAPKKKTVSKSDALSTNLYKFSKGGQQSKNM